MSLELASQIVAAMGAYALAGAIFALWFATFGASRIDPAARGMPLQARLLILPASALLWPLMLYKSFTQKTPPVS